MQYLDHAEHNIDGDEGFLERKHIVVSEVVHIGKEANNIEDEPLDGGKVQVFRDEEENDRELLRCVNVMLKGWGLIGVQDGG